jgi:hypothetical protein
MYGLLSNICPKNHPNVGIYTSTMVRIWVIDNDISGYLTHITMLYIYGNIWILNPYPQDDITIWVIDNDISQPHFRILQARTCQIC